MKTNKQRYDELYAMREATRSRLITARKQGNKELVQTLQSIINEYSSSLSRLEAAIHAEEQE